MKAYFNINKGSLYLIKDRELNYIATVPIYSTKEVLNQDILSQLSKFGIKSYTKINTLKDIQNSFI